MFKLFLVSNCTSLKATVYGKVSYKILCVLFKKNFVFTLGSLSQDISYEKHFSGIVLTEIEKYRLIFLFMNKKSCFGMI